MNEFVPPVDREAEQSLLGGMMLSPSAVWDAAERVQPSDFYEPKHEAICQVIFDLANGQKPTGAIEVCDEIGRRRAMVGDLDRAYVFGLVTSTPTAINAGYWADIVREKAVLRRLAAASTQIAQMAASGEASAVELVEQAREVVDAVSSGTKSQVKWIGDSFDAYVNSLEEKPRFVPSPWWNLNSLIGGFRAGCLYIVAARPAQGKSIVGLNAAMRLAQEGPVAYVSLEMGRDEITARMIAQVGQVHLTPLMNHTLSPTNWGKVAAVKNQIKELPLAVATMNEVSTMTQVRAFARSVSRKASKDRPMAGLVVDYIGLLSSGQREESRQVEVAGFTRALKMLAKDLDIPVIALSQLNRQMEKGGVARKPVMSDLRESGALEQDADVVMLLHHDEKNTPNDLNVIVPKVRHGQTGDIRLSWEGQFARVLARAWSPTQLLEEGN